MNKGALVVGVVSVFAMWLLFFREAVSSDLPMVNEVISRARAKAIAARYPGTELASVLVSLFPTTGARMAVVILQIAAGLRDPQVVNPLPV